MQKFLLIALVLNSVFVAAQNPSTGKFTSQEHVSRGFTKSMEKDFAGAVKEYTMAIQLSTTPDHGLYHMRASAKSLAGDLRGALADYELAYQLQPSYRMYAYGIVDLLERLKRYDECVKRCSEFISQFPNGSDFITIRGQAKFKLNDVTGAMNDWDKAINDSPDGAGMAYFHRGLTRIHQGKIDAGCQDLSKAGELGYDLYNSIKKYCN
jgi:tetratricopeptide (TPR) repeat protein